MNAKFDETAKGLAQGATGLNKTSFLFAQDALQVSRTVQHAHNFQGCVGGSVENEVFLEMANAPTPQATVAEVSESAKEWMQPQQFELLLHRRPESKGSLGVIQFGPRRDVGQVRAGLWTDFERQHVRQRVCASGANCGRVCRSQPRSGPTRGGSMAERARCPSLLGLALPGQDPRRAHHLVRRHAGHRGLPRCCPGSGRCGPWPQQVAEARE